MPTGIYKHKGRPCSEETKRKISASHKGKHHSEETKRRMSINRKNMSEETKRKIIESNTGKKRTLKQKERISLSLKGVSRPKPKGFGKKISKARKGKHHSKETKKKMSKSGKGRWQNPEYREKQLKAIFAGYDLKPTKPERKLRNGLNKMFPGEYKYVGDGSILIGYKNPDFINVNGQKKIIEMFGDYWHSKKITGRTKREEEKQRIKHFAKYGYKTLIVWERELKNIPKLKRKLTGFHNA